MEHICLVSGSDGRKVNSLGNKQSKMKTIMQKKMVKLSNVGNMAYL